MIIWQNFKETRMMIHEHLRPLFMIPYTYNYNDFQEAIFMKLALLVANRGFFPSSVIESARADMLEAYKKKPVLNVLRSMPTP